LQSFALSTEKFGQSGCHPEQALFAQREPALSEAEGDLGEPRESTEPALSER